MKILLKNKQCRFGISSYGNAGLELSWIWWEKMFISNSQSWLTSGKTHEKKLLVNIWIKLNKICTNGKPPNLIPWIPCKAVICEQWHIPAVIHWYQCQRRCLNRNLIGAVWLMNRLVPAGYILVWVYFVVNSVLDVNEDILGNAWLLNERHFLRVLHLYRGLKF